MPRFILAEHLGSRPQSGTANLSHCAHGHQRAESTSASHPKCRPFPSACNAILLGVVSISHASLFFRRPGCFWGFLLQPNVLIPFWKELVVFFGLPDQPGHLPFAGFFETFLPPSHQCRGATWFVCLAKQNGFGTTARQDEEIDATIDVSAHPQRRECH